MRRSSLHTESFIARWGRPIFVSLYACIGFVSQLVIHWKINLGMREIHEHFKDLVPSGHLTFLRPSLGCKMTYETALAGGLLGGTFVAVIVLTISKFFVTDERYADRREFREYCFRTKLFHSDCICRISSIFRSLRL